MFSYAFLLFESLDSSSTSSREGRAGRGAEGKTHAVSECHAFNKACCTVHMNLIDISCLEPA